ncbi:hypothetical protein KTAU_13860 [Thermogemmatispora aurantia]|uniref:Uncharacterized protein n=1 Tax=Thermogemmatispora aurantia TaxID=2045279 RepID=A0A5J4K7S4_9CHLR|nr:hypothetical protein [Thermogemmatispora aurantia]GER82749.1 hypothetical protein KTAU_13860 [Thermogemmatispora aurantia]
MSTAGFVWGIVLIFVGMVVAMLVAPVTVVLMGAVAVAGVWFVVGLVMLRRGMRSGECFVCPSSSEEEAVGERAGDRMFLS